MALFKKDKKADKQEKGGNTADVQQSARTAPAQAASDGREGGSHLASVLLRPRITEKATFAAEENAYVFEVLTDANKQEIAKAIQYLYNVRPVKVNTVKIPRKRVDSAMRRRRGFTTGGKKAYVYLKEGDRIEVV
jgi:large subunit ribosomal protein L23